MNFWLNEILSCTFVCFKPSWTSTMEFRAKIVNVFQALNIFTKSFIVDVRLSSKYTSVFLYFCLRIKNGGMPTLRSPVYLVLCLDLPLPENCPNTEFFLVRIFPHSEWIRRDIRYNYYITLFLIQTKMDSWIILQKCHGFLWCFITYLNTSK